MNWETKAALSRWIARLPQGMGNRLYGQAQRIMGSNRSKDRHFTACGEILDQLHLQGRTLDQARCLEIGTGKRLVVPVTLWLAGSEEIITVDAHRVQDSTLIRKDLREIPTLASQIATHPMIDKDRLDSLCQLLGGPWTLEDLMRHCHIDYRAPVDAAHLDLEDRSVDYQISYTVFEHIPPGELGDILQETRRVLRPEGLAMNLVDYSDHFSHRDPSIHGLNFLQYTDQEWAALAGNRFHYLNRLRHDDMRTLHEEAGLHLVSETTREFPEFATHLPALSAPFSQKPDTILRVATAWIIGSPPKEILTR